MTMSLFSPAFSDDARIPDRFTCTGEDVSPPLEWTGAPAEVASFALVCEDPDAPAGTWHHWALFDLPADTRVLDTAYPTDARVGVARQAVNDFNRPGYGGPCPPPGHGLHHYHFRLLALSVSVLDIGASPNCPEVQAAARDHVLTEAVLTGTYSR